MVVAKVHLKSTFIILWLYNCGAEMLSENIVFTCVVLHNILKTPKGGVDRAPTPANDIAALQNEHVVYVPDDNYRNPLRESKHQKKLLNDYFNHVGSLAGQEDRI